MADDDVARAAHAELMFARADALAGRGLAGDRDVGLCR